MCDQFETARVQFLAARHRRMVARFEWTRRLIRVAWLLMWGFFVGMQVMAVWQLEHGGDALDFVLLLAGWAGALICWKGALS